MRIYKCMRKREDILLSRKLSELRRHGLAEGERRGESADPNPTLAD